MASGYSAKRSEENLGNRKLCHLNPFEFFDHMDNGRCRHTLAALPSERRTQLRAGKRTS